MSFSFAIAAFMREPVVSADDCGQCGYHAKCRRNVVQAQQLVQLQEQQHTAIRTDLGDKQHTEM
jgi:Zn ribbon nucleic-acid-binding protein